MCLFVQKFPFIIEGNHISNIHVFYSISLSNTISALVSVRLIASGQDAAFLFSRKYSYQNNKYSPNALDGFFGLDNNDVLVTERSPLSISTADVMVIG